MGKSSKQDQLEYGHDGTGNSQSMPPKQPQVGVPRFTKDEEFPGEAEAERRRYLQENSNTDMSEMNITAGNRTLTSNMTLQRTGPTPSKKTNSTLNDTDPDLNFALSVQKKKAQKQADAPDQSVLGEVEVEKVTSAIGLGAVAEKETDADDSVL